MMDIKASRSSLTLGEDRRRERPMHSIKDSVSANQSRASGLIMQCYLQERILEGCPCSPRTTLAACFPVIRNKLDALAVFLRGKSAAQQVQNRKIFKSLAIEFRRLWY
jgi:hypothetical protein